MGHARRVVNRALHLGAGMSTKPCPSHDCGRLSADLFWMEKLSFPDNRASSGGQCPPVHHRVGHPSLLDRSGCESRFPGGLPLTSRGSELGFQDALRNELRQGHSATVGHAHTCAAQNLRVTEPHTFGKKLKTTWDGAEPPAKSQVFNQPEVLRPGGLNMNGLTGSGGAPVELWGEGRGWRCVPKLLWKPAALCMQEG